MEGDGGRLGADLKIQAALLTFSLSVVTPFSLIAGDASALAMEQGSISLSTQAADETNRGQLPIDRNIQIQQSGLDLQRGWAGDQGYGMRLSAISMPADR